MFKRKSMFLLLAVFASVVFIITGCGNNDSSDSTENNASNQEGNEPRTVTDAMGHEVEIPANPEKVLASYLEDNLVALDITPVAQWSVGSPQEYLQDSLKDVPTIDSTLPFEAVASFNPDLIIIKSASMVEGDKYEQYNKIAPTYVMGTEENGDWRKELQTMGEIFDKKDEAQKVLDDYDAKAADAKEKIQGAIGDESAAAIWLSGGQLYIVNDNLSSGAVLYGDLGITVPEGVKEISENATANWNPVSLEQLAEMDVDHLFLVNSDEGDGSEILDDPLLANVPAIKNGNVYKYDKDTSWLYTGPIANEQIVDDAVESLVK
ncbi:iron complex transport system substrate-binding protein [Terribacillus halophilus]|uniref:Iron complex transport system substrate-binding protein n=1 Tax=Terribacillus halophilus TaxID=361279 RepID=A0A1G6LJ71_9BACI|nr:ABC transporter substrate-binding protein [Terribacillus halophilus]SDC43301.1 iron complex transport system substrate-binding protein [Terribacillus halophilus]